MCILYRATPLFLSPKDSALTNATFLDDITHKNPINLFVVPVQFQNPSTRPPGLLVFWWHKTENCKGSVASNGIVFKQSFMKTL
jgi:hypothetical protein